MFPILLYLELNQVLKSILQVQGRKKSSETFAKGSPL